MIILTDICIFPIFNLIIEYLNCSYRCVCNDYISDIYNLSIINKEVNTYIKKYNLIEKYYKFITIPNETINYFTINNICYKHHNNSNNNIYLLFIKIKSLINKKINYEIVFSKKYNNLDRNKYEFIKKLKFKNISEIIDCNNYENLEILKNIINTYCKNINITNNSYYDGRGLEIIISS